MPGGSADARADHLHRRHQRIGHDQRPASGEPEPGAGLAVGRDAAGIVVRRAGDQSRPDDVALEAACAEARRLRPTGNAPAACGGLNPGRAQPFHRLGDLGGPLRRLTACISTFGHNSKRLCRIQTWLGCPIVGKLTPIAVEKSMSDRTRAICSFIFCLLAVSPLCLLSPGRMQLRSRECSFGTAKNARRWWSLRPAPSRSAHRPMNRVARMMRDHS